MTDDCVGCRAGLAVHSFKCLLETRKRAAQQRALESEGEKSYLATGDPRDDRQAPDGDGVSLFFETRYPHDHDVLPDHVRATYLDLAEDLYLRDGPVGRLVTDELSRPEATSRWGVEAWRY